jgi:hypothetical protein
METVGKVRDVFPIDSRYIVQAVDGAGSRFFDDSSMRFFSSRVASSGWKIADPAGWDHTYVLVTSECGPSGVRAYTVRVFTMSDCARRVDRVDDAAGFQGYGSRVSAHRAAARLARELAVAVAE